MSPEQTLQDRVRAAQKLSDRVRRTGQRLSMDAVGYVILHHGTSSAASEAIFFRGIFERASYFAPSAAACKPHVQPKHGAQSVYASYKVDPRDIEFSTGTGEFFAPLGLCREEAGTWCSPVRIALQEALKACPEMAETDGRCHDLALALWTAMGQGHLEALLRTDEEDASLQWYSHMVFVDATGQSWDAEGDQALDRWTDQWGSDTEWEYLDVPPADLSVFLAKYGQALRPAPTNNRSEPSCPAL